MPEEKIYNLEIMYFFQSNSNSTFVLSEEAIQNGEPGGANCEPRTAG